MYQIFDVMFLDVKIWYVPFLSSTMIAPGLPPDMGGHKPPTDRHGRLLPGGRGPDRSHHQAPAARSFEASPDPVQVTTISCIPCAVPTAQSREACWL